MNSFSFSEKNILITGSNGLLGREIVELFQKSYSDVNLITPSSGDVDLRCMESVNKLFSLEGGVDIVIHLAAVVFGLKGNMLNQYNALHQNTTIDSNVFDACKQYGVEKIFYASSVATYGFPFADLPLKESDLFFGEPHSGELGYSMAKRHAYAYLEILSQQGVDCIYGLFTNLYGRHDTYNDVTSHVVPSLICKALKAKKNLENLSVWGNGEASRDFMYAKDAARAVIHLLSFSDVKNEVCNIASGTELKISDIAESLVSILELTGIEYDTNQPVGIKSRSVDVSRLKELGFSCEYDLQAGLEDVLGFLNDSNSLGDR